MLSAALYISCFEFILLLLFFVCYSRLLDGKTSLIAFYICVESSYFLSGWCNLDTLVACEYVLVQIIGERFVVLIVNHISGEKGYTPCSTFSCCLHYRDGRVDGGSEYALTYAWSLEQTTVTGYAVHLHMLFLEKHVVADL